MPTFDGSGEPSVLSGASSCRIPGPTRARFEAPGKAFLLGEYAVLTGSPAWLVAVGPRFQLELAVASASGGDAHPFQHDSPAERLCRENSCEVGRYQWQWRDPHEGRGGFGASGAQFALTFRALAHAAGRQTEQKHVLEAFHSLHAGEPIPPSGADIAVHWLGGIVKYRKSQGGKRASLALNPRRWLLFSATGLAGRKVNTHEHLSKLGAAFFSSYRCSLTEMEKLLSQVDAAKEDESALIAIMNAYAHCLESAGLSSPAANEDRRALMALPGVAAVKGTGAGLSDAVWVVLSENCTEGERAAAVELASHRGLRLLSLGRFDEPGITEEL